MFFQKKKVPHDPTCLVVHVVVAVLLFLTTLSALCGMVLAHYDMRTGALVFGTNAGSLSLIAFAISVTLWMKSVLACMCKCDVCGATSKK